MDSRKIGYKLLSSFLAMAAAWLGALVLFGTIFLIYAMSMGLQMSSILFVASTFAVYSGVVVSGAWLLFFMPAHLLLPDLSLLRSPRRAGAVGAAVGFGVMYLLMIILHTIESGLSVGTIYQPLRFWQFPAAASFIGGLASFVLAVYEQPRIQAVRRQIRRVARESMAEPSRQEHDVGLRADEADHIKE